MCYTESNSSPLILHSAVVSFTGRWVRITSNGQFLRYTYAFLNRFPT